MRQNPLKWVKYLVTKNKTYACSSRQERKVKTIRMQKRWCEHLKHSSRLPILTDLTKNVLQLTLSLPNCVWRASNINLILLGSNCTLPSNTPSQQTQKGTGHKEMLSAERSFKVVYRCIQVDFIAPERANNTKVATKTQERCGLWQKDLPDQQIKRIDR